MNRARILAVVVGFGAALGCSSDPAVFPVRGIVKLNGKPLPPCEGRISFHPEKGRLATAPLAADGTFVLTTYNPGDGALVGSHKVTIKATRLTKGSGPKSVEDEANFAAKGISAAPNQVVWIVPARYAETATSPFTAVVEKGDNVIDFDVVP